MITQLSLFWTILFLAVGSLALDVSNGYRNRVMMQDAADAAALGAMYLSSDPLITKDEAKTRAAQLTHSNLGSDDASSVITNKSPTVLTGTKLDTTDFTPGNLYVLNCNSSVTISVPNKVDDTVTTDPGVISEVAVIADCPVKFGNGVALENAIFANTSTDDRSFSAPQGLRIGRDDNCAADGGAKLITMGGVSSAAKISFFGGQILAAKDVSFSAQADGIEGVAIVSGGKIDGTSNSRFGHCDTGMEGNIEMSYFRLRM